MSEFDVVIIGSGPGGYVAAIRASQLGLKVAIVEAEEVGGVCLNWGCIPTKALLKSAEIKHLIDRSTEYGLVVEGYHFDLGRIVARSRQVSKQLAAGVQHLLKKNKVALFKGTGFIQKPGVVKITSQSGEELLSAKHTIIATGARARLLPNMPLNNPRIWTAKTAMTPEFLPKSLLIVGSGAIGIEFASFYQTLGSKVTVVEMQNRILPQEDDDIADLAKKSFEGQGVKFHLGATVKGLSADEDKVVVTLESVNGQNSIDTQPIEFEAVIIAIGIVGNTENIGLEQTKVEFVKQGQIRVDEWGATQEPGIYAIGDVAGPPWLAHKASHQGVICVEKIANHPGVHPLKMNNIPGCTYSLPQIASIGLTEHQAREQAREGGYELKIGSFPFRGNGKAIALGEPEGLIKTIFNAKTGELLGAHMIGAEVTELIQGFAIAKNLETTEAELMQTIFPHPTLSEMMQESVLDAYGKAIHF